MPELERLRGEYEARGVGFLALSLEPDRRSVQRAAKQLGLRMQVATTEDEVLGPLGVNALPSTVFLSREGLIVAAASGRRDGDFLEKRVRALLER